MELGNLEKVLRVGEGRRLKRLQEQAAYITSLEPEFEQLSAADLQGKTVEFRQRLENGESLDDLVFEAFAAVREARRRASRTAAYASKRSSSRLSPFSSRCRNSAVLARSSSSVSLRKSGSSVVM